MQRKIAAFLIGLLLLASLPLTLAGMVDTYLAEIQVEDNAGTEPEFRILHKGECPIQQGDLRNLKHASQKIRTTDDLTKLFVCGTPSFSSFKFALYIHSVNNACNYDVALISPVPLFLRNRVLII